MTDGAAGWAATTVRCPRGHDLTTVIRTADGTWFAPRVVLTVDTAQPVDCPQCGRSYLVDPVEVLRAARSGVRKLVLPTPRTT